MTIWPGKSWETVPDPAAAGLRRSGLDRVVDMARSLPTTALLVVAGGHVVLDYGDSSWVSYLASARKSVLSVLFGGPVTDGVISLDATLDELGIDDVGGLLPVERRATVRDLLTARSGVYHPAATPTGLEDSMPERGSQQPGTCFRYNNWDFNVLGTIFERQTGRGVFDALRDDLAEPLAFQDFDHDRQRLLGRPERSRHLAHHLFLSGRDLARIGLLVVRGGKWGDRQVVPRGWLAESTSAHVSLGALDYGYLWWLPHGPVDGAFLAVGNFGQYLLGLPRLDLVIVHRHAVTDDFAVTRNQTMGHGTELTPDTVSVGQFLALAQAVLGSRT